jgi:hypothetical protein
MAPKQAGTFDDNEAKTRFEMALRGARIAGPKHNESLTPKRVRPQQKKRKKAKS